MNEEKFNKWIKENSYQMDQDTLFVECAKHLRVLPEELDRELANYYDAKGNYQSELVPEYVLDWWINRVGT